MPFPGKPPPMTDQCTEKSPGYFHSTINHPDKKGLSHHDLCSSCSCSTPHRCWSKGNFLTKALCTKTISENPVCDSQRLYHRHNHYQFLQAEELTLLVRKFPSQGCNEYSMKHGVLVPSTTPLPLVEFSLKDGTAAGTYLAGSSMFIWQCLTLISVMGQR